MEFRAMFGRQPEIHADIATHTFKQQIKMASISYVSHPAHVHMFKRSFSLLDSGVLKSQDPD